MQLNSKNEYYRSKREVQREGWPGRQQIYRNYRQSRVLENDSILNYFIKSIKTMGNLLYIIAIVLIIAWAIGFWGLNLGSLIHILLVIAVIAIILRLIRGRRIL